MQVAVEEGRLDRLADRPRGLRPGARYAGMNMADFQVDHNSHVPLYYQLQQKLRDAITSGDLVQGGLLPAESRIASEAKVSRFTVRQAIADLEREGLLFRQQGRGTFIVAAESRPSTLYYCFWRDLDRQRRSLQPRLLRAVEIADLDAVLPDAMHGRAVADRYLELVRVWSDSAEPLALERVYMPLLPDRERQLAALRAGASIYQLFSGDLGASITHVEEELHAVALPADFAQALGRTAGAPGLEVTHRAFAGAAVLAVCICYTNERSRFRVTVPRDEFFAPDLELAGG